MQRVQQKFAVIFTLVLIVVGLSACKNSKDAKGKNDPSVAATVNEKPILMQEVDLFIRQSLREQFSELSPEQVAQQFSALSPVQLADARIKALDRLIEQEVLFQRAEGEKLLPSEDEVTQIINAQKVQNGMTDEDYQRMLQETGDTEQGVRTRAKKTLAIQKLLERAVGKVTIKDNEVAEFFNKNPSQFIKPRAVLLSAIVVDPRDSRGAFVDDAKNEFDAQSKADAVYKQLEAGEDFATLARKRSEDESALKGGELTYLTEPQLLQQMRLPEEVVNSFFGPMQVGKYTKPVRLLDGNYYIFKLNDRRLENESQTLETPGVKERINAYLINERQRIVREALLIVAMNEAKINNKLASDLLKDPASLGGMQPA